MYSISSEGGKNTKLQQMLVLMENWYIYFLKKGLIEYFKLYRRGGVEDKG